MQVNTINTETKLLASVEQSEALIQALRGAIVKAQEGGTTAYARVVLDQFTHKGPWRLTVGVRYDAGEAR